MWTHAGKQGLDRRDQRAPRQHAGYGSRICGGLIDLAGTARRWWPAAAGQLVVAPDGYTRRMEVLQHELVLDSRGHGNVYDVTPQVSAWLRSITAVEGQLTIFVPGSTAAVTTIEFEPGAVRDLVEALENIAPSNRSYHHDLRWGDGNGFSHLRAALMGPSLTVPVAGGRCIVGTWQQIVLVECDLAPRRRRVVLSFVGTRGPVA